MEQGTLMGPPERIDTYPRNRPYRFRNCTQLDIPRCYRVRGWRRLPRQANNRLVWFGSLHQGERIYQYGTRLRRHFYQGSLMFGQDEWDDIEEHGGADLYEFWTELDEVKTHSRNVTYSLSRERIFAVKQHVATPNGRRVAIPLHVWDIREG